MSTIEKIIVVGGGSAGWMTAATLIKNFPEKEITVIESPDVPIVGVGESTLGQINEWLHTLDIKDEDWMQYCDASYKLSIKFTNFYKKDTGSFHYPFGIPMWNQEYAPQGLQEWYHKKVLYPDTPVTDFADTFWPIMALVNQNKITENKNNELPGFRFNIDTAYHFDAIKFGSWLKNNYCLPRGVKLISNTVKEINLNKNGIEFLILNNDEYISADLFIDCTGFKSLLLNKLNVEFESYSNILPNDSAWAVRLPYTNKEQELEPFTNCTAIENGWVWNIPLWSRIGTGYVYSSKYINDDNALEQFKNYLMNQREVKVSRETIDSLEFKNIKMKIGIHKELYVNNVCAIGLSAGFIEPLESNGLYTVHEFLNNLVLTLSRGSVSQFDKDAFNEKCRGDYKAFAEFVSLHYALSARDDTDYWRDIQNRKFPKTMPLGIYSPSGIDNIIFRRMENHIYDFEMGGMVCVATGMNYFPVDKSNMERYMFRHNINNYTEQFDYYFKIWDNIKKDRLEQIKSCPSLYEFLKEKYV